ncbi:MAG: hypothetical protein R2762_18090 [Bryobacteraceae bacterium]
MTRKTIALSTLLGAITISGFGQAPLTTVDQVPPALPSVGPGQIAALFLWSTDATLGPVQQVTATSLPLPGELAGISVIVIDGARNEVGKAGLISVERCCFEEDGILITLQWPTNAPQSVSQGSVFVEVRSNGRKVAFRGLNNIGRLRLLSGCSHQPGHLPERENCNRHARPLVTHADGSLVTPANPAQSGETVVIYAVGPSEAIRQVPTGHPSPNPPLELPKAFRVSFDIAFGGSRNPITENPVPADYVSLTPGAVGLYQIHAKVPELPAGTPLCATGPLTEFSIQANMTITVRAGPGSDRGVIGLDRIGMCAVPSEGQAKAEGQAKKDGRSKLASPDAPRFDPEGFPLGWRVP